MYEFRQNLGFYVTHLCRGFPGSSYEAFPRKVMFRLQMDDPKFKGQAHRKVSVYLIGNLLDYGV
jgi:hypothetical protein